ncbi:LLM class F420-dependent oxidoreductase [Spongiactinospora rosea]|uniref:LLM class F420-dependent oxidoreductase n=1 Tax=Spongiactinospora rosea TaxID=2248750 RepID=A0A366LTS1_9ACTN|nr:LLM class flavin-dependent oxidoreductase [Spongiactinospora rosea]RBQ17321.1 LLM class F420-dependent oxidoreductase [Spongiactinospora rosea]
MRLAISIPQTVGPGPFDPAALRAYLARAEELGFEGAWTTEQVIGSHPHLGPLETLSFAAACTTRIRLGCATLISSVHSPAHLAKAIATLDQLSQGRLDVGIAIGGRSRMLSAFGVDPETFVARFAEGLRLMKDLWTLPVIDFEGRFWRLHGAAMEPKPYQRPHPPIWFGGGHPNALRRAVRLGDAFIGAGSVTTAQFTEHVRIIREALAEQRRDPADFPIAKRVYIAVDDDAERARTRIAHALDEHYGYAGRPGLAPVAVAGTPGDCVAGLRAVAEAGAQMIVLNPLFDDLEQMERLSAEVVPELG